tara:strand:- start:799 stop:966 length:168 start_codon:yes stop_codon:yes gene_type:complete
MKEPTITVTTTNSVYYLTIDGFLRATQNGYLDHLGSEEIVSVDEGFTVDWKKIGF